MWNSGYSKERLSMFYVNLKAIWENDIYDNCHNMKKKQPKVKLNGFKIIKICHFMLAFNNQSEPKTAYQK